jgi:hypothetical protein
MVHLSSTEASRHVGRSARRATHRRRCLVRRRTDIGAVSTHTPCGTRARSSGAKDLVQRLALRQFVDELVEVPDLLQ